MRIIFQLIAIFGPNGSLVAHFGPLLPGMLAGIFLLLVIIALYRLVRVAIRLLYRKITK